MHLKLFTLLFSYSLKARAKHHGFGEPVACKVTEQLAIVILSLPNAFQPMHV